MSETFRLKRDFANVTDATSMILVALVFRSRRLRDFICGLQGVAGARHEFDCTHLALARRLDHSGRVEAAELFVTRYLAALEKEQKRVGRYIFRIERGGGIDHRPTHYVDYITRAAVWATQQAQQSALWKDSHTRAIEGFIPAAIKMLPLIEEEETNKVETDSSRTTPGVQLARNETHAFSRARANLNIIKENGGDVITYAENLIARFTAKILERAQLVQQGLEGEGISFDTPDEGETAENIEETQSMTAAALAYACAGVPVFPVKPDKSPYTANGFKDASTDEATVRRWWRKWPDAGIGVPTGDASGWLAQDIDPRHGGDASLTDLIEQHGELPETLEARTGGGGHHIIFAYPQGSNIRNSAGKLGEGIDVRGEGGYIIVAPSVHASGNPYQWINEHRPAPAPEWLLKLLTEERQAVTASDSRTRPQAKSGAAMGGLIPEQQRNDTLFRIAAAVRGQGGGFTEILSAITEARDTRCEPGSHPVTDDELRKIANSAMRYAPNSAKAARVVEA